MTIMALFDETPDQTTVQSPLTDLVGEGKKFKTVEDLAKSKVESDSFIEQIKAENAQLRADLAGRTSIEEQIKALTQKAPPIPAPAPTERVEEKVPDLSQRIKAELETVEREKATRSNVETVTARLIEVYGSEEKAAEVIANTARDLGVSKKFLLDSAAASPKAFFKQIGLDDKSATAPAPRSEVNTEAFRNFNTSTQHQPGTYEHIRDSFAGRDVKKLLDPAYLNATMAAALKDPEKFFAAQG